MTENTNLVSKVLVLDSDPACFETIKRFCDDNNLVGLTAQAENVMTVLRSNVDLGGILLSENYDGQALGGRQLATRIHAIRPELPIFLRRESAAHLDDVSPSERQSLSAAYTIDAIDALQGSVGEFIFGLSYPNVLVRGISEITKVVLESQFKDVTVEVGQPYIVHDRLIYGEIFTLIPIESAWCRGYMMLQTEEMALLELARADKTHIEASEALDFRNLNSVLGEITNLVWGAFKNRFVQDADSGQHLSQVPLIVNHLHRYISFGSENPQLCFKYTLTDSKSAEGRTLLIYQKFVFNLNWSPDDFQENQPLVEDLVASGELEMF